MAVAQAAVAPAPAAGPAAAVAPAAAAAPAESGQLAEVSPPPSGEPGPGSASHPWCSSRSSHSPQLPNLLRSPRSASGRSPGHPSLPRTAAGPPGGPRQRPADQALRAAVRRRAGRTESRWPPPVGRPPAGGQPPAGRPPPAGRQPPPRQLPPWTGRSAPSGQQPWQLPVSRPQRAPWPQQRRAWSQPLRERSHQRAPSQLPALWALAEAVPTAAAVPLAWPPWQPGPRRRRPGPLRASAARRTTSRTYPSSGQLLQQLLQ
mmetsp:Transcript_71360/g.225481  ORF Transcript_71360/g.225481 Transcript_71360/m.225481 type:complete len:261 (-) Transcript_71360:168-950(-)